MLQRNLEGMLGIPACTVSSEVHDWGLQVDWGSLGQTQNAQLAYEGRDMDAPVQHFAQPSNQHWPAYSADLGDQLDLLSGGMLNAAPAARPPTANAQGARPGSDMSHEVGRKGSFSSSSSPWSSTQMQAGVSQETMERHAMLPMSLSSPRPSRRSSQVTLAT